MSRSDEPDAVTSADNSAAPALTAQLEALRQRALAKSKPVAAAAEFEDEIPRWVALLPPVVIGFELLSALGCAAIAAARWASPNELPGPGAVFVFVVVFQVSMTIPGLMMLMGSLRPMAAAALFTLRVPGVIEAFASESIPGDGTWLENPGVDYAYEVHGDLYHGSIRAEFSTNVEAINRRYQARLPQPGATVTVCCHPDHPQRSAVAGQEPSLGIGGVAGACMILFGFVAPLWDLVDFVVRPP
jgi:hypothetical protein